MRTDSISQAERDAKKWRYTSLLYKPDILNSRIVRSSALARISGVPNDYLKGLPTIVLYLSLLGGACSVVLLYYFMTIGSTVHQVAAVLSTVLFVTFSIFLIMSRDTRDARIRLQLEEGLEELAEKIQALDTFIREFDKRTERYFHCVTHSKTSAYYLLNQALTNMAALEEEVRENLEARSRTGLLNAFDGLSGNIGVADGLTLNGGTLHSVPLAQLTLTLDDLIDRLSEDMEELEEDIRRHQGLSPKE